MIDIFTKHEGQLVRLEAFEEGCWANLCDPTPQEIRETMDFFGVDEDFVKAALDEEESAHMRCV